MQKIWEPIATSLRWLGDLFEEPEEAPDPVADDDLLVDRRYVAHLKRLKDEEEEWVTPRVELRTSQIVPPEHRMGDLPQEIVELTDFAQYWRERALSLQTEVSQLDEEFALLRARAKRLGAALVETALFEPGS